MSYIDEFNKNFNTIASKKDGLFYERPWWLKWSVQGAGLASMAIGSAIIAGTFGAGTPVGASMIAGGAALFGGGFSSREDITRRHTLFDMAQEIDGQKDKGEQSLQKNRFTGNLFPYIRTYIPFSSARESLHEIEKLHNYANRPIRDTKPPEKIDGISSRVMGIVKDLYKIGDRDEVSKVVEKNNKQKEEIKESSIVPNSSMSARFCKRLTEMFRSVSNSGGQSY